MPRTAPVPADRLSSLLRPRIALASAGPRSSWPRPELAASFAGRSAPVDDDADADGDGVVTGPPTVPLPQSRAAVLRRGWFGRAARRGVRLDPGRPGAVALVLVAAVAAVVAGVGVWTSRPQAEPVHGLPAVAVDGAPGAGGQAGADGGGAGAGAAGGGDACGVPRGAGSAGPVAAGAVGGAGEVSGGAEVGAGASPGAAASGGAAGAGACGGVHAAGSGAAGAPGVLVVSVAGRVARPGVVRVPDGARVADVLAAAGGAQPGVDLSGLNLARRVVDGEQIAVGVPPAPDAAGQPPPGPSPATAREGPGGTAAPGAAGPAEKIDLNTASMAQLDTLPGVGPVTAQHIVDWRSRNGRFARVEQLREIDGIGERRFQQLRQLVTV